MSRVSSERRAAYELLRRVDEEDAYANLVMPQVLKTHQLTGRDAAFAVELGFSTLRMRRLYEAIVAEVSGRDISSLDPEVTRVLLLGVHQALRMRVPPHASVSQSVDLAKAVGARRAAGLVNASMRAVVTRTYDEWCARVASGTSISALALRHSHPTWMVEALHESLLGDARQDQLEDLLVAHNSPAAVVLATRPGLSSPEEIPEGAPGRMVSTAVTLAKGTDPGSLKQVRVGSASVQDEGSQAVTLALTRHPLDNESRWLDLCAGPGGKAALLGAVARERGVTVDALEIHKHRAALVQKSVRALAAGTVAVHHVDALEWEEGGYDRVLLDAPCTGTGSLRRRPEARWRRQHSDLEALLPLQSALFDRAVRALRPGGVMAYVTCSPLRSETRDQLESAMSRHLGVLEPIDARPLVASLGAMTESDFGSSPDVQLWTDIHGTDSMYVALLKRTT